SRVGGIVHGNAMKEWTTIILQYRDAVLAHVWEQLWKLQVPCRRDKLPFSHELMHHPCQCSTSRAACWRCHRPACISRKRNTIASDIAKWHRSPVNCWRSNPG